MPLAPHAVVCGCFLPFQLFSLPKKSTSVPFLKMIILTITKGFGKVNYMRIKVRVDVTIPLKKDKKVRKQGGE